MVQCRGPVRNGSGVTCHWKDVKEPGTLECIQEALWFYVNTAILDGTTAITPNSHKGEPPQFWVYNEIISRLCIISKEFVFRYFFLPTDKYLYARG